MAVLALLLGIGDTALGAFNQDASELHYGDFLVKPSEVSESFAWEIADPTRGNGEWIYDDSSGVLAYVQQNPWTMFDPLGLASKHEEKWQAMAQNESVPWYKRSGAAFMAAGEALNPFRSDSSIRTGNRKLQAGVAKANETLDRDAPWGVRHVAKFSMGVGLGANPVSIGGGAGELGDQVQEKGLVNTAVDTVKGTVEAAIDNPAQTLGAFTSGGALGKSFMPTAKSTSGMNQKILSKVTTDDGFLFKGFDVKAPFDIPTQRFGNMSLTRNDFWGLQIGTGEFLNRTAAAIKPEWNSLTQYTSGTITKGSPMKVGIIGPQGVKHPGGALQFVTDSSKVINQTSKIIDRKK